MKKGAVNEGEGKALKNKRLFQKFGFTEGEWRRIS